MPSERPTGSGASPNYQRLSYNGAHQLVRAEDSSGQVLAEYGAALCWADQHSRPVTPLWRTAGWGYLRFHQGAAQRLTGVRGRVIEAALA